MVMYYFTKPAQTVERSLPVDHPSDFSLLCGSMLLARLTPNPLGRISETTVSEHSETHIAQEGPTVNSYTIPVWEEAISTFRGSSHPLPPRTVHIKCLSNDKCSINLSCFYFYKYFWQHVFGRYEESIRENQKCCCVSWCLGMLRWGRT